MKDKVSEYLSAVELARVVAERRTIVSPDAWDEESDSTRLVVNPLVSVEVVTYNHERYLTDCVESIVRQKTTFPFEVIIGVDVSPDGTLAVARRLQKKYPERIRLIVQRQNVGLNMNSRCVRMAMRGRFAALVEGDDWWLEGKLQRQTDYLIAHPECSLIFCPEVFYSESKGSAVVQVARYMPKSTVWAKLMVNHSALPETSGTMCRCVDLRAIYENYSERLSPRWLCQDVQLFATLATFGRVHLMAEPLAVRRFTEASLSSSHSPLKSVVFLDSVIGFLMMMATALRLSGLIRFSMLMRHFGNLQSEMEHDGMTGHEIVRCFYALYPGYKGAIRYWVHIGMRLRRLNLQSTFARRVVWSFLCPVRLYRRVFVTTPCEIDKHTLLWMRDS